MVQLPLGHSEAGGRTCGPWDKSPVCDFQEVSLKGKGQALLHFFLLTSGWSSSGWSDLGNGNDTKQMNKLEAA